MIYPNDFINKIICGDSLDVLNQVPDDSIDVIFTSPPYWQQRKYTQSEKELGMEFSISNYIYNLTRYFYSMKKKLRKSGSLWVNIGDKYYSNSYGTGGKTTKQLTNKGSYFTSLGRKKNELPVKSLCNIPARFSIEMQNAGFILRNIIIWHKPNAFVTSAKDRFTVDFEYLFWFVNSSKYYFKQQFEPFSDNTKWEAERNKNGKSNYDAGTGQETHRARNMRPNKLGRNKRTVWSINTQPIYGLSHFAKFPEKLVETPLKATCPPDGVVLDPFMGSGTTALVCKSLGINYIGIDLSEKYCEIARQRLEV